jgi:Thiolase, C-terminal domain
MARMSLLLAGLPIALPGSTVYSLCCTDIDAIGGVESMNRALGDASGHLNGRAGQTQGSGGPRRHSDGQQRLKRERRRLRHDPGQRKVQSLGKARLCCVSRACLVVTTVYQLRRTGGRYALCTMCIGVGQGIALLVERVRGTAAAHGAEHQAAEKTEGRM